MIAALLIAVALTWQPTSADLVTLKRVAVGGNYPAHFVAKTPSEMPRYDPVAFYPGPADPHYIWENRNDALSPDRIRYRNRALILAAMDFGAAGEQWKTYYDELVAEDKAQGTPVADPYRYRHAFLDDLDAKLEALAPAVPPSTVDPPIDAEAATVSDRDLTLVANGYFTTPAAAETTSLPQGVIARYAGSRNEHNMVTYIVERSSAIDEYRFYTDRTMPGSDDAVMGAFFEAIVDSGAAGSGLKTSYDAATDKARFGFVLARAFDMQNSRLEKSGHDEAAWIVRTVRPGMKRAAVNALLRSRNLKLDEKPLVDVLEFPIHSSIVCSTSIPVAFTFDTDGRLERVEQQALHSTCV
ncbi:MAG TPA: hypothetical protein VFE36_16440 [Candidatus Baltobacteraceae bacterium]|jgi:hypothetical protein|nr:hypothetical protein [Candidatus Baltobacteraceae bacterium]